MKNENELRLCLNAGYTLVGLETQDDVAADQMIRDALCGGAGSVWAYDNARGGIDFTAKTPLVESGGDLLAQLPRGDSVSLLGEFLDRVITDCRPVDCVMVVRDINEQMKDPQIVARIKAIASFNGDAVQSGEKYAVRIIAVSSSVDIPDELAQIATVITMTPPDGDALARLVADFIATNALTCGDEVRMGLVTALKGLTEAGALRVLSFVRAKRGETADAGFVEDVRTEKARIVRNNGLLETVDVSGTDCSVGGMENLMAYLDHVALIFGNQKEASEFGVDQPKGILIAGMPGCGKSLAAKFAAKTFGIPLVRLDMGSLMGKYIGESERKLREALSVADATSPCVLWIDEIEKAFAGIGSSSDGGTATRLFGYFLTWMSEKKSPVYTIATANDVTNLPPELMRRGRFDNLFSVDLPAEAECRAILDIHLKRRGHQIADRELDEVAALVSAKGYCGADIERLVQTAIEIVFSNRMSARADGDLSWAQMSLDAKDLRMAAHLTHSVTEVMGSKLDDLRGKLAAFRMDAAGTGGKIKGRRC